MLHFFNNRVMQNFPKRNQRIYIYRYFIEFDNSSHNFEYSNLVNKISSSARAGLLFKRRSYNISQLLRFYYFTLTLTCAYYFLLHKTFLYPYDKITQA